MIDLSLNEAETLAAKAARGAGFSWGLTEEIGRASRALAQDGADFGAALLALLRDAQSFAPPSPGRVASWRRGGPDVAAERPLCPIRVGALLRDHPVEPGAAGLRLHFVGFPIWLDAMLRRSPLCARLDAADAATLLPRDADSAPPPRRRAAIDAASFALCNAYAARTYVPESARSRARGAGGGRVDDD